MDEKNERAEGQDKRSVGQSEVDGLVRRFVLDMSKVAKEDLPERFQGGPLIIPLMEGQFECDYDVIESELPADFVKKWHDFSNEPGKEMGWPLGINDFHLERMPAGAILRNA